MLFKISKGLAKDLPTTKTPGHMWLTQDDGKLYVDVSNSERICLNDIPTHLYQLLEDESHNSVGVAYYYNGAFYEEVAHTNLITPSTNRIYFDIAEDKIYRYDGSAYIEVCSLKLGETATTAYRGDRGKIAYDHSQKTSGNPHNVTKSDVGLGNVGNFKAVSTVASQGLSATEQANARANIGAGTSSFSGSYTDLSNKPTLGTAAAKDVASSGNASTSQIVMGNDTRLSDARPASDVSSWAKASTKPSYTASEVGAIATTAKGAASGVAELDANGKVPSSQLPSFVDDVIEANGTSNFPITGETGKIYVDTSTNKTYRWGGSSYTEISASLALGETSSTAYRGDRGKTAYDHSQSTHARADATKTESSTTNGNIKINGTETTVYTHPTQTAKSSGLYKITTDSTGHVTNATAVVKDDITGLGIPGTNTNTTYTLTQDSIDGHKITFTPSSGGATTITIPDNNTTYNAATQSAEGLMSAADKKKLDGIAEGAQVNTVTGVKGSSESSYRTGNVNITSANIGLGNVENKSSATIRGELTKANVTTALGYTPPTQDTTYSSLNAASGGTNVSLVTTGEKFDWNEKMSVVEVTQAEYDAMSASEKNADIVYLISDSPDNPLDFNEIFGEFASIEYTNIASKAYAVGDYLVYDNKFYRVKSSISQGNTIVPNTNVVKTTVGDELDSKKLRLSNNVSVTSNSGGGFELQPLCTAAGITSRRNIISIVSAEDYYYVSAPFADAGYAMIYDTSTNSKQPNKTLTVRAWYYQ